MTTATHTSALDQVRSLYPRLSEDDQLSLIVDLLQGGQISLHRSEAFGDDLWNLDRLLSDEYRGIAAGIETRDIESRERGL